MNPEIDHFAKNPELADPNEIPTWIIHEDENFIAFNKPGWLVCHPSKNGPFSSLVGAVKEVFKMDTSHLVSRLDRETSGVVVLAKNHKTASVAQKAIEQKQVGKKYLAILHGKLPGKYHVAQPLADDKTSKIVIKQACATDRGSAKTAETIFTPLAYSQSDTPLTLVEVELITGRKHQIRAHAQWISHPLVGEKIYGADENIYLRFIENGLLKEDEKILLMKRQALHAYEMDFSKVFPKLKFNAKLPQDLKNFISQHKIPIPEKFKFLI